MEEEFLTKEMIQEFKNGMSITKIGEKHKKDRKRISILLKERGFEVVNSMTRIDKLTEQDYQDIKELYSNKKSIDFISKDKNISEKVVRKYLIAQDLFTIDDKYDNDVYRLYFEEGLSIKRVAKELDISRFMVENIFTSNDWNARKSGRIHKFNQRKFKCIDSPQKAYWFGFLMADGYNSEDFGKVELTLAIRDKDHVYKFKEFLEAESLHTEDKVIKLGDKEYEATRLSVSSREMSDDLAEKGCIQNKSLVKEFPSFDIVNESLVRYFIIGYFDANGSVNRESGGFYISCGSKKFINKMFEFLKEEIGISNSYISKDIRSNTYNLIIGNIRDIARFRDYYNCKDFTEYIKRKRKEVLHR